MKNITLLQKKMKRRNNFFKFILLLLLISLVIVLSLKTNFFAINDIKVIGNNNIPKDILTKASSINIGENIFKISTSSGIDNIKKLPYTKEVKIRRKFPKGIVIEIVERKEIAQIKDISSFILIDNEGHILDVKDIQKENLPIIVGFKIKNENLGESVFARADSKLNIEFIREGYSIGLLQRIKYVDMADNNNINITLIDDVGVAFGTLDNVIYKLNLLDTVLKDIKKRKVSCTMILMNKGENPIIVTDDQ